MTSSWCKGCWRTSLQPQCNAEQVPIGRRGRQSNCPKLANTVLIYMMSVNVEHRHITSIFHYNTDICIQWLAWQTPLGIHTSLGYRMPTIWLTSKTCSQTPGKPWDCPSTSQATPNALDKLIVSVKTDSIDKERQSPTKPGAYSMRYMYTVHGCMGVRFM